ncbi:creatininase family protein [Planotetraspora kaengkrachanensis]|uniref:Creatinine amidohydrolase n=1 Tax=Planotetraspora kaengkrachanensis TaxID=575193 RepID=A0A8J3PTK1_9ACTN|nr:creatininase family protein [Planotetraspora kaengkrachanensis]GIG80081.1 creatinine amidohydrolase [Planotetraspora kaengkrachanensis]
MHLVTAATTTEEAERGATVAVLPVGSFEQHGSHLPLTTDTLIACGIARALADEYQLLLLPPITIACSHEHAGWAGTVSISSRTLIAVITDIADSLGRSGIEQLVVVNGHGGNYVLSNIVQEANVVRPRMALYPSRDDWARAREAAGLVTDAHDDMHAGEIEISLLLHLCPDQVRESYQNADHTAERPHLLVQGLRAYTETGVIGRPSLGTDEKGKAVLTSLTADFAGTLDVLAGGQSL